ncbi:MAG: hypothetical protein IPK82_23970 [Polyangiaceae bacterium]|nr:hypothetical protein [Polyangiaceae bacterium]
MAKKVSAALAIDPARVTLVYTAATGANFPLNRKSFRTHLNRAPTPRGMWAVMAQWQEIADDFDLPTERPRRVPEDAFWPGERMADDLEFGAYRPEKTA